MIKIIGLYLLCVWLHHDVAVDEDGADDGEWEERMSEDMDGNPENQSVTSNQSKIISQIITFWSGERVIVNTKLFLQKT